MPASAKKPQLIVLPKDRAKGKAQPNPWAKMYERKRELEELRETLDRLQREYERQRDQLMWESANH